MAALNLSKDLAFCFWNPSALEFLVKHADVVWLMLPSKPCHPLSDSPLLLTAQSYLFLNEMKGNSIQRY